MPFKNTATAKDYRRRNRSRINQNASRRRAANPAQKRRYDLKAYGLTESDFDRMLRAQNGRCAGCGSGDPGRGDKFFVDHCHLTRRVRGLLCLRCNLLLGHARDDASVLLALAEYLTSH